MNNNQEARDRKYRNIIRFSDENKEITAKLPEYNVNLGKLKITEKKIQDTSERQKADTKGITKYKLELRKHLVTLGADTARKLTSYAKLTNNTVLESQVNFTESDFKRFSDNSLKDYSQIIYNSAETIISQLTQYDITADSQALFLSAINDYIEVLESPNLAETIKKQATEKLVQHFIEGESYVANMAAAVEIVRLKEPIFYLGFKTAQKSTVRGKVKLSVKGKAVDTNGEPLSGVIIMATLNGQVVLVKKTYKKGGFHLKSLAPGNYQFVFKKAGLTEQINNVVVNDGELTKLNVVMPPNIQ